VISGAHVILYSKDAEADRAFLRDILRFSHVDVGGGWLIFGLPPAEVAVHPSDTGGTHELYLMCEDIERFRAEMEGHGVATAPPQNMGWGVLTEVALPGGGKLGVYQPRHERPAATGGAPASKAARKPGGKRLAARKPARKKPVGKAGGIRVVKKTPLASARGKKPLAGRR